MGLIKKLLGRVIGKKVSGQLDKWGVSKTKVIVVAGVLIAAYDKLAPQFGWPPALGMEIKDLLELLGLWALRDGVDTQKV